MSSPRAAKVPFWGGMRYNGVTIFRKAAAALKIMALVENTVPEDLAAQLGLGKEHGLSLYIEACGHKILFDMGQSGLFARNAAALGVDLAAVDLAVLSHGHYDHGGGLARFLELNSTAPVYLNEHAFEPHYHGAERYIGLDPALAASPRLHLTGEEAVLAPGLTLAACSRQPRRYDLGSFGLTVQEGGAFQPEDFRHEHYLLIEEAGRRVLISGCSHKGILNIVDWFRPDVLVGGFHFSGLLWTRRWPATPGSWTAAAPCFTPATAPAGRKYEFMARQMSRCTTFPPARPLSYKQA